MLFGAHVSSSGGIHTAIDRAEALKANAIQVFTQSPRMWRATDPSDESVARFR
jgi:deoxyribonuclease-4